MFTILAFALIGLVVFAVLALVGLFVVDEMRNKFTTVFADGMVVKVIYNSIVCQQLHRLTYVWAFTLGTRIYVRTPYLVPSAMRHELQHVRQWERLGTIGFIYRYVRELLTYGFSNAPLEREARNAAAFI